MSKADFSTPRRMSGGAFIILFLKTFKDILFAIVTYTLFRLFNSSFSEEPGIGSRILIITGITILISLIVASLSYFTKKFFIRDGNLVFIHGVINRENTCVPLDKIHSLRTKKGIWYRLLDLRGIVFDTLASRMAEIELILDESEWHRLLSVIDKSDEETETSTGGDIQEKTPAPTVNFPTGNLLLAALCQNHLKGMAVLGSFLGAVFGNLDDISEETTNTVAGFLDSYFEELLTSPLKIICALAVIYVITLVLWLGRVLLRYSEMTMRYDRNLLTFDYGLFNRTGCRFFYDKICTIWIKRNFLEKRFGFCTLMLKQALNASAEKNDDNLKIYGTDESSFFLEWWLGNDYQQEENIISARSGRGVFFTTFIPRLLLSIIAGVILYHDQLFIWLIAPTLYLVFSVIKGICAMRHSHIDLKQSYFVIHNGSLAEMANFMKYSNLEVVRIRKTPFTGLFHRVSLSLSTSGSTFTVRSLREDEASIIYSLLLHKTEKDR